MKVWLTRMGLAAALTMTLAACSPDNVTTSGGGNNPPPGIPTVDLSASATNVGQNGNVTLTWTSSNVTTCNASGAWSGVRASAGSELRDNLTATGTYTLTCSGSGGNASDSVTVTVSSTPPPPGAACGHGAINSSCLCGNTSRTTGYCCNDVWFDPNYGTLTGGCPATAFRYVDPAHPAAADSNTGTAAAPWATLGRAVWGSQSYDTPNAGAALQAGEVVIVRSGVHSAAGKDSRYNPVFNPVNAGSAGAPIVIKAAGNVTIQPLIGYQGLVQSAGPTSVRLAADASALNDAYAGWTLRIVAGTGAGQARKIAQTQMPGQQYVAAGSYDGAMRTATMHAAWTTVPDATSLVTLTRPGPMVGAQGRNHIVWDGFRVIEADSYHADTGPVVIWGSENVSLLHLNIVGMPLTPQYDNHNGIRVDGSRNFLISSCEISGFRSTQTLNNLQNEAGIMLYGDHDGVIENNLIYNINSGIFPKGNYGTNLLIRQNIVHDARQSFRVSYHSNVDIHQNIVYDSALSIRGAEGNSGVRFYNNVGFRNTSGPNNWFGTDGIEFFNNVYLDVTYPYDYEGALGNFTSNHNHFYNYTGFRVVNSNIGRLDAWQALGYDLQATESDPLFVDPGSLDFRLQDGSPLAIGGRGGTWPSVRGAYVTGSETIGPRR
ncbi:MAG: right-handed parallel beta-helix repeat-containing protein [Woeseiaceae bacterium]|nr:right-handed parallel beta-helix repeat-containing protein [Woeseiaceae bacterium]